MPHLLLVGPGHDLPHGPPDLLTCLRPGHGQHIGLLYTEPAAPHLQLPLEDQRQSERDKIKIMFALIIEPEDVTPPSLRAVVLLILPRTVNMEVVSKF